jgi:hypothetical protein
MPAEVKQEIELEIAHSPEQLAKIEFKVTQPQ